MSEKNDTLLSLRHEPIDLYPQQPQAGLIGTCVLDRHMRVVAIDATLASFDGISVAQAPGYTLSEIAPILASLLNPLLVQGLAHNEPIVDLAVEVQSKICVQVPAQFWLASMFPVRSRSGVVLGVEVIMRAVAESGRLYEQCNLLSAEHGVDGYTPTVDGAGSAAPAKTERAAARLERLQSVTALLSQALTPEQVARVIVEQGRAAFGARAGTVVQLVDAGTILETIGEMGHTPEELAPWNRMLLTLSTPLTDAVRSGTPVFLPNLGAWSAAYPQLADAAKATHDQAWAAVPLLAKDGVLGCISLSFAEAREFGEEDRAWMLTLALQCAQALERAYLYAAEQSARVQAEEAVRVRDELVALVSHDLKSPLTAILGRTQLAQRRLSATPPALDQVAMSLELITATAERMSMQIDDLLDLARLQAGVALELRRHFVDLVAFVQQLAAESRQTTEHHQIEVIAPTSNVIGRFDPIRLDRVVRNLLDNALKYSPLGGVIKLILTRETTNGDWAVLNVCDQGTGIPAAELTNIFERFHRASNVAAQIAGTGLGLASVRHIVEQHGGTISVASIVGEGTTFTLRLPLEF